jgi:hypothetical protein
MNGWQRQLIKLKFKWDHVTVSFQDTIEEFHSAFFSDHIVNSRNNPPAILPGNQQLVSSLKARFAV